MLRSSGSRSLLLTPGTLLADVRKFKISIWIGRTARKKASAALGATKAIFADSNIIILLFLWRRPVIHQIGGIDRANPGREVPARCGLEAQLPRCVGSGELTECAGVGIIAIVSAGAGYRVIGWNVKDLVYCLVIENA